MLTIKEGDVVVHYKRYRTRPEEMSRQPDNLYLYIIEGVVPNITTNETVVIYRALYNGRAWVRTVSDFLAFIPEAGRCRFEKWDGPVVAGSSTEDGLPLWEET